MNNSSKVSPVRSFLLALFLMASLALPALAQSRVKEIVVVYKTHFDIGYTDLVTNVLTRYRTKFVDGAMKAIEHSRSLPPEQQFVWTVPGWPLKEMLWPGQTPARRAKILQALKEGRLTVHAMPFSLQTEIARFGRPGARHDFFHRSGAGKRTAAAARRQDDGRA